MNRFKRRFWAWKVASLFCWSIVPSWPSCVLGLDFQLCGTQGIWGSDAGGTTRHKPGWSSWRWVHHPAAEMPGRGCVAGMQQEEPSTAIAPRAAVLWASSQRWVIVSTDFTGYKGGPSEPLSTSSWVSPQQIQGSNISFEMHREVPPASLLAMTRHRLNVCAPLSWCWPLWHRTMEAQQFFSVFPTGRFNSAWTAGRKHWKRWGSLHWHGCETELLWLPLSLFCRENASFPVGLLTALPWQMENDLSFLHFLSSATIFLLFSWYTSCYISDFSSMPVFSLVLIQCPLNSLPSFIKMLKVKIWFMIILHNQWRFLWLSAR